MSGTTCMSRIVSPTTERMLTIALTLALVVGVAACGDDPDANGDDDNGEVHGLLSGVELETRGDPATLLAQWDPSDGWQDEDGDSIDELPTPVQIDGGDLQDLTEDGPNASLTVRYLDEDGDPYDMDTVGRDDDTGERECTEYSTRYTTTADEGDTDVIAWPSIPHPDSDDVVPPAQFAETDDGEIVGLFHCDHVHFYPERAGTVDIEFLLWHIDHSDDATDGLTLRVEEE